MKRLNGKSWFMIILGAILIIGAIIVMLMSSSPELDDVEGQDAILYLGGFLIVLAAVCVFMGLKPLWSRMGKKLVTIVATYESFEVRYTTKDNTFAYFNENGTERRIVVPKDVYSGKLLLPGAKYRIEYNEKDNFATFVERVD